MVYVKVTVPLTFGHLDIWSCVQYIWSTNIISINTDFLANNLRNYLKENLRADLSISAICKRFSISKNFLYSIMHKYFDMTLLDYILKLRISNAKSLLIKSLDPIYLISAQVGIDDYNYFTKVFKKATGLSPKEYRQEHVGKFIDSKDPLPKK